MKNLSRAIERSFSKHIVSLFKKIGLLSGLLGYKAFLVGGPVRDLLLGIRNLDIDIVIEGGAIMFGRRLSSGIGGSLTVHKRFGTCTITAPDALKIDLATARTEVYEAPAALPTVLFSSIKNDLIRRDFTINAMAISLQKENFGQLIDFFGGEKDLDAGRIRVLHEKSFIDDPTRILRAVRFEQRLGFRIDQHTEKLIIHATREKMFDMIEEQRIRDEIVLILKEKKPFNIIRRMNELHGLTLIHPRLRLDRNLEKWYRAIDKACQWYNSSSAKKRAVEQWLMYFMALIDNLSYRDILHTCDTFEFKRGERLRILSYKKLGDKVLSRLKNRASLLPSAIYGLLEALSYEVVLLLMARSGSAIATRRIKDFFQKYNGVKIHIRGDDIKALGLKPGPNYKKILEKVLRKKLDGAVRNIADELRYAGELARKL